MKKCIDLTGKKFGKLTVIKRVENNKYNQVCYLCKCECGNEKIVIAKYLKNGNTKSCGCLVKEKIGNLNKKHNLSKSRLYKIWSSIKTRCYNNKRKNYKWYGAKGIIVCDEWKNDFMNFYNWAISNRYTDELTIDRIDNNKNYSPENCRWITTKEQCRNRKSNKLITYKNETHCLIEWSEILNIDYRVLQNRINNLGWSINKTFNTK